MNKVDNLVWIDLEMTGLNPKVDQILEFAIIITDAELNILEEASYVIGQSVEVVENMNDWCKKYHGKSGLTDNVLNSDLTLNEVKRMALKIIKKHTVKNKAPLCGNSIGQDKAFLTEHMPEIVEYLHYRVIDVSSVSELVRRWGGEEFEKDSSHRAIEDIKDSIDELQHYRQLYFNLG